MKFLITKRIILCFNYSHFHINILRSRSPKHLWGIDWSSYIRVTETKFFCEVTLCRWASCSRLSYQFYIITAIIVTVNIIIIIIIVKGYGFFPLRLLLLDLEDALDHSILVLVPLSQPVRSLVDKTGGNRISSA